MASMSGPLNNLCAWAALDNAQQGGLLGVGDHRARSRIFPAFSRSIMMAYHLRYRLSIFRRPSCQVRQRRAVPVPEVRRLPEELRGVCCGECAEPYSDRPEIVICNNHSPRLPCHLLCKYGNSLMILIRRIVGGHKAVRQSMNVPLAKIPFWIEWHNCFGHGMTV